MISKVVIQPQLIEGDYRKPAVISLLLHFLFLAAIAYHALFTEKKSRPAQESAPSLAIISDGEAAKFIPSELMEKAPSPPEQTRRISDTDTLMRGEQHRNELDRADQSGIDAEAVVLRDAPESPQSSGQAAAEAFSSTNSLSRSETSAVSQAALPDLAKDTTSATPSLSHQNQAENVHAPDSSQENIAATALPHVELPAISSQASDKTTHETQDVSSANKPAGAQTGAFPARVNPPPGRMSFRQQKTLLEGRAPDVGASSWDAVGTTLGEYQAEIYRRVGENWHRMIRERRSIITYGRVVAQVEVSSSGLITSLTLREWPDSGTMLGVVSEASIRRAGPFRPFEENLRRQIGDFMRMEISFIVY